jgi:hypothetical protein
MAATRHALPLLVDVLDDAREPLEGEDRDVSHVAASVRAALDARDVWGRLHLVRTVCCCCRWAPQNLVLAPRLEPVAPAAVTATVGRESSAVRCSTRAVRVGRDQSGLVSRPSISSRAGTGIAHGRAIDASPSARVIPSFLWQPTRADSRVLRWAGCPPRFPRAGDVWAARSPCSRSIVPQVNSGPKLMVSPTRAGARSWRERELAAECYQPEPDNRYVAHMEGRLSRGRG